MKTMKLPLIIMSLAVSWVLGWGLSATFNSSVSVQQTSINEDGNRISELKLQIVELKNKIAIIKAELPRGAKNNSALGELNSVKVPAQAPSSTSQSADNYLQQTNVVSNSGGSGEMRFSGGKSAHEKFLTERVDIDWAIENEKKLKDAFYTDVNLQTKELQSVVCKSTACEIKIHLENKGEQSEISEKIMSRIRQKDLDLFAPIIWTGYSEQEKTANFYINRE